MDEYDIAQEVRLERKVHKGSFFLVEGVTDVKRFSKFIDEERCSLVNCYGRRNVIGSIKLLYDEGFPGALGAIDADFDRILGCLEAHEGLVYSEAHDFDLDWAQPSIVSSYLIEVGELQRYRRYGSAHRIIDLIMEGLRPVSVARLLSRVRKINCRVGDIDISGRFSGMSIDIDAYLDLIFGDRAGTGAEKLDVRSKIGRALNRSYDLRQLTNGHDFHCALGATLRGDLGCRRDVHTWRSEVEMHIRLAFSDSHFVASAVYRAIQDWEAENRPFLVLHQRFCH